MGIVILYGLIILAVGFFAGWFAKDVSSTRTENHISEHDVERPAEIRRYRSKLLRNGEKDDGNTENRD